MIDYENEAAEVRARINLLLKEKGITQNAVAAGDAPAQKRLNSQLSHGAAISLDTLLRILAACPDVSGDWLLRGAGDKYKTPQNAGNCHLLANSLEDILLPTNCTSSTKTIVTITAASITSDLKRW